MSDPFLVRIGPLAIRWYGFLIIGGAVLSAYVASREAKRQGEDPELVWDMLLWVLFTGIVGARLYHILSTPVGAVGWDYYKQHPLEMFIIWRGGLAIYGALAGGFIGLATYVWRKNLSLVKWTDIVFPTVLLAQAIGRWGNYINQEAYGSPTTLPWGIYIPPEKRLPGLEQYERYHPVFLYESLWCLAGFFLLLWIERKFHARLRPGDMTALYFFWYPAIRIFTESLRPDAWTVGGMPTAQLISIIAAILSFLFLVLRHTVLAPKLGTSRN